MMSRRLSAPSRTTWARSFIGQYMFAAEHIAHVPRRRWDIRLARRKILNTVDILLTVVLSSRKTQRTRELSAEPTGTRDYWLS